MSEKNSETRKISLELNSDLITTIRDLGHYDSFDGDLIGLLVENLENRVQKINETIIKLYQGHLAKQDKKFDIETKSNRLKPLKSKKIQSLLEEKETYLVRLSELKKAKEKLFQPLLKRKHASSKITQFSQILAIFSNRPTEEFQKKLGVLYGRGSEKGNPLSYKKLNLE